MPDRRSFLRRLLGWPLLGCAVFARPPAPDTITLSRVVLNVRPPAPDTITLSWEPRKEGDHPAFMGTEVVRYLSDAGKAAWDREEELDSRKGHFLTRDDFACLVRAKLKGRTG